MLNCPITNKTTLSVCLRHQSNISVHFTVGHKTYCSFSFRSALGERLQNEDFSVKLLGSVGNREMTFATNKNKRDRLMNEQNKQHREERKRLSRPGFKSKFKSGFYKTKRK